MAAARCLHCEIAALVDQHIALGLTINEIVFKQVEAIAQVLAGIGDHQGRRRFLRDIERQLREMTARQVARRAAEGVEPYPVMKMQ